MKRLHYIFFLCLIIFLIQSSGSAQTHFTGKFSGDQQNPAVTTDATGTGFFVLTEAGLEFSVTVEGLTIANAHFHNAAPGVNGGVVRAILGDFVGNTASGIWTSSDTQPLTPELIADLLAGNIYVNVHTAANPGGEIRAQVNLSAGTGFAGTLDGGQQNPPVTTTATGTGVFTLTDAGLAFRITVEGLTFTNAHFHNAAPGVNGGVVRAILDDFVGNTATGLWTSNDAQPLTQTLIDELLAGNIYVNVHTAANPGGEIRTQVNLRSGTHFAGAFTGEQQNPAVTTNATGTGVFTLTDAGLLFNVTVEGLTFTNAHFHLGAPGVNGGVVRAILGDFVGNTASGIWTNVDAQPLTQELINELLAGNLYVNVHTATNPGGEIRAQVNLSGGTGFGANFDGAQQNPPVTTNASGTGAFTLTEAGLVFNATVEGLTFTNAHFHNAAPGVNGGVVRSILADFAGNTASGVWTGSDTQPLTPLLSDELLAGNIYVNVHTAANPGGEIRGQVNPVIIITGIEPIAGSGIPLEFSLSQNYPNPFNPGTEIQFNLNRPGNTVLKVYTMLGQEVATLINENLAAGSYRVVFDAGNLASGIYLYQLETSGQRQVKQMTLIR